MFSNLIKKLKSTRGNSLAEFAVTTAMMATLATTAAPKFGSVGDGAKEKKTMANIDKILTVANNYYNQAVSEEGRGRFPGQSKYDSQVGGYDLPDGNATDQALEAIFLFCNCSNLFIVTFKFNNLNFPTAPLSFIISPNCCIALKSSCVNF